MNELIEQLVYCPYCGEEIQVLIDQQEVGDEYIEDCQVCCRPIVFKVTMDSIGAMTLIVSDENDV